MGIRLLQAPASEASDPRASLYIIDHLAPGTVVHREFQVSNLGNGPLHVTVYPAAATIGQGGFQFAAGHTQNEMTPWVRISQTTVNLAPHSAATLTATIAVPRDAPSGSQYGVIWAEQDTTGSGNVLLVSRVGIRLYLSIGAGGAPAPSFTVGTPTVSHTSGGSPIVHVPVHNTGGVALDVRGTLQLTGGPGGLQDGPFPAASVDTLAPGQAHPATFALSSKIRPALAGDLHLHQRIDHKNREGHPQPRRWCPGDRGPYVVPRRPGGGRHRGRHPPRGRGPDRPPCTADAAAEGNVTR